MLEFNTLAVRYYLEDLERAAKHDIAEQIHRERAGSFGKGFAALMQTLVDAFSPFTAGRPHHSEE